MSSAAALPSKHSARTISADPNRIGHGSQRGGRDRTGQGEGGPASKRIIAGYGFWIFLLSDIVMFAAFFAAHAVLAGENAGGPTGHNLFDLRRVAIETCLLLASSFTCGLSSVASKRCNMASTQIWLLVTGLLGAIFLLLEVHEFASMVGKGAGPTRSAFLSSFFALVGCHGIHVGVGILWLGTMMAQLWVKGFRADIRRRLMCFNLFWHALDIIWVAIFTIVYELGSRL